MGPDISTTLDAVSPEEVGRHLAQAAERLGDFDAFVPCSARSGVGLDALVAEVVQRLPEGPHYYPEGVVSDQPETFVAAELVREQLLRATHDELPHSISVSCEVLDDEEDGRTHPADVLRLLVTVRVERESQKGIVIGRGGAMLKDAVTHARRGLEKLLGTRVYLETRVRVERDWQRRPESLDRLGF